MSYIILDLEVQNIPYKGQVASPFNPENYIVAVGYAEYGKEVHTKYFDNKQEADQSDWAEQVLERATTLVMHNATFEIHWLLHRHNSAFMNFLKRGGKVFCTQYAEYLLTHQTELYPKLDEVAPKYGGTHKIDEVKLLWELGKLTAEIDKDLLLEYLGGANGDIENTSKVLGGQLKALLDNDMLGMFMERMDGLLFNAFCTYHGLYVNLEVAEKNHKLQLARAEELTKCIQAMLPTDIPKELVFNFTSDYHMSALLFGGVIKYRKQVSYEPKKYVQAEVYMDKEGQYFTEPNESTITYLSGKNKGTPKLFKVDTTEEKTKWGEDVYHCKGLIDLEALPKHVSEQYLGKRAEFRSKRTLADDITPVYSTSKESLDLLATFTDIAKPLKELAQLDKDNNTYYLSSTYNPDGSIKNTKGMLQFVGEDGIIHHQLNGTATVTTRLSSSNPNLQNIPRDGTSKVKEMFSSRFGEDGRIVEVDYTALEVVDLAAVSDDVELLRQLLAGTDMHSYRLAGALEESYTEVLEKVQNKEHPEHKTYKELRTKIKPKAFAAQYGASAHGISFATGASLEEAERFLETEAKLFPESTAFKYKVREEVEFTGSQTQGMHREQTDEGAWSIYRRGYFKAKGGTHYSFRQYKQFKNGTELTDYKDTQLANYVIQGESSFIVQAACGRVLRWWLALPEKAQTAMLPINTVHDAIYFDCIDEKYARAAGKFIQKIMEDTPKDMCRTMPGYKEWRYDSTPFPAVPEFGKNMLDKEVC